MEVKATDRGFQAFAQLHPHEAYETFPEEFWAYFQTVNPNVSRNAMEQVLKETKA